MKVVFPICCGVDVHKTFLVATLITTQGIAPSYHKKRFSTFNNSIREFKQWLLDSNCLDVCMESTGKYWIPVYNLLEDCIRAGLTPGNNQSAGKKKSVRITRAGVYLKPALVQVAHAAVKSKESSYYRIKYERIAKRRGKKRAIIAIARKILTSIYKMLQTGEVFNPCDLFQVDMPQELLAKQKEKAVKQAIKLLVSQGIVQPEHIAFSAASA